jgi:hypothetical protein
MEATGAVETLTCWQGHRAYVTILLLFDDITSKFAVPHHAYVKLFSRTLRERGNRQKKQYIFNSLLISSAKRPTNDCQVSALVR